MRYGEHFHKVTGSGNDFVAFDRLGQGSVVELPAPAAVRALCSRGEGVGADGVLVLMDEPGVDYRLVYFNADGSRAELCGNASLCGVRLAVELGRSDPSAVSFVTDAGPMRGRITDGLPEIDLTPPRDLSADRSELWAAIGGAAPGEQRLGYVRVGVPHLVVLCDSAQAAELERRGPLLRHHPALADGANVNFVSPAAGGEWAMRTFERGVEGETLACGTGSVATALALTVWAVTGGIGAGVGMGAAVTDGDPGGHTGGSAEGGSNVPTVRIRTRSGRLHRVTLRGVTGDYRPSLAGEGRIVYRGELGEGAW